MESGLQSNEVRIPKAAGASSKVSSKGLLRTKAKSVEADTPVAGPPEFDLGSPCQYFKSSFARSLSMHSQQTKSLDFGVNFGLAMGDPNCESPPVACSQDNPYSDGEGCFLEGIPPLPRSEPPSLPASVSVVGQEETIVGTSSAVKRNRCMDAAATKSKSSSKRRSFDSTEIEMLRLRKECQNLVEENRRLVEVKVGSPEGKITMPEHSANIEAVILQSQVDTLQWQLKQVESSREMYREVMEEMVRFLERCHRDLDFIRSEQNALSKSINYLHCNDTPCGNDPGTPRARSSTNLVDGILKSGPSSNRDDTDLSSLPSAIAYNNYRDYTWRRSPKRNAQIRSTNADQSAEKLSQEAYRLLRTAQNLMNTQEPYLTVAKPPQLPQHNENAPRLMPPNHMKQIQCQNTSLNPNAGQPESDSYCLAFSRKLKMRESRSSLRSSTDGSVHSTYSSKTETDEEMCSQPVKETAVSTEDESGFSSISSFQEIGLPLHSTLISHSNSQHWDDSSVLSHENNLESKNSTLKASQGLGLQPPNHRRWESAPVVPPRPGLHLFSSRSGEESSSSVLWV